MVLLLLNKDTAQELYGNFQRDGYGETHLRNVASIYPLTSIVQLGQLCRNITPRAARAARSSSTASTSDATTKDEKPAFYLSLFKKYLRKTKERERNPIGLQLNDCVELISESFLHSSDDAKATFERKVAIILQNNYTTIMTISAEVNNTESNDDGLTDTRRYLAAIMVYYNETNRDVFVPYICTRGIVDRQICELSPNFFKFPEGVTDEFGLLTNSQRGFQTKGLCAFMLGFVQFSGLVNHDVPKPALYSRKALVLTNGIFELTMDPQLFLDYKVRVYLQARLEDYGAYIMYVMLGFHQRPTGTNDVIRCENRKQELSSFKTNRFPEIAYETDDDRLRLLYLPSFMQLVYPVDTKMVFDNTSLQVRRQYSHALTPVPLHRSTCGSNVAYHQLQLMKQYHTLEPPPPLMDKQRKVVSTTEKAPPDPFSGRKDISINGGPKVVNMFG